MIDHADVGAFIRACRAHGIGKKFAADGDFVTTGIRSFDQRPDIFIRYRRFDEHCRNVALHQFIRHTRWGMAMRAMAFDYVVVPLMGVPINRIAALTFAIGSGLAAAAGILFGVAYPVLDPYMGILIGWKAFVAAILGGRGSVVGATLAGFLLGFIEMFVPMVFPSTFRDLIAYSIILLILVFRPHGFFGEPYSARLRL